MLDADSFEVGTPVAKHPSDIAGTPLASGVPPPHTAR